MPWQLEAVASANPAIHYNGLIDPKTILRSKLIDFVSMELHSAKSEPPLLRLRIWADFEQLNFVPGCLSPSELIFERHLFYISCASTSRVAESLTAYCRSRSVLLESAFQSANVSISPLSIWWGGGESGWWSQPCLWWRCAYFCWCYVMPLELTGLMSRRRRVKSC